MANPSLTLYLYTLLVDPNDDLFEDSEEDRNFTNRLGLVALVSVSLFGILGKSRTFFEDDLELISMTVP